MKRFAALLLALLLVASVSPFAAAGTVPDNPTGSTVGEIAAGDTMKVNSGIVTDNLGEIDTNYGTVATNNSNVVTNNSTVTTNNGAVVVNNGTVETNAGTVTSNAGTLAANTENGLVTLNAGNVKENAGTVTKNTGIVAVNAGEGIVSLNNTDGTVVENSGTVTENDGTVKTNNANVSTNRGTVADNESNVDFNYGTVTENNGTVAVNANTVKTNRGKVGMQPSGTVETNYGVVTDGRLLADGTISYGFDTLVGINYASGKSRSRQVLEQAINPEETSYTIPSYADIFSRVPSGKRFSAWRDANGVTYNPGETYSEVFGLDLTAILKYLPAPVCAANADGSAAVTEGRAVDLLEVSVDGTLITGDCYTVENAGYNASAFAFSEAFLATLFAGSHEVTLRFSNGACSFTFTK